MYVYEGCVCREKWMKSFAKIDCKLNIVFVKELCDMYF